VRQVTAPGYISPCCGVECNVEGGMTKFYVCQSCGHPCDPMPIDLRNSIVAEGMRRAAGIEESLAQDDDFHFQRNGQPCMTDAAAAIRREADRLSGQTTQSRGDATQVANRRQSDTSDNGEAKDGRDRNP